MKRLRTLFQNQSLLRKLLILYVVVITIPVVVLSIFVFERLADTSREQTINALSHANGEFSAAISSHQALMEDAARGVRENWPLLETLSSQKEISTQELIDFHNYFTKNLERVLSVNPEIYSFRFYINNPAFLERWPIVYSVDRIQDRGWKKELDQAPGGERWILSKTETQIPKSTVSPPKNLVSLNHVIYHGNETIGYLETTMLPQDFFKGMYQNHESHVFHLVVDSHGNYYHDQDYPFFQQTQALSSLKKKLAGPSPNGYFTANVLGETLHLYKETLEKSGLTTYTIIQGKHTLSDISHQRTLFILVVVALTLVLYFITYQVISLLLSKLQQVIFAMQEVEQGNLSPEIHISGQDEAGQLARHLQYMLAKIKELMDDVVHRTEIAKDAEIRALQSQINTHFLSNTLESIRMMAEFHNVEDISEALTSLGQLMRYSMTWGDSYVLLSQEIRNAHHYVDLLNMRRDHQIILDVALEPSLEEYIIPKLSLQPIIENAVLHGIDPAQADSVIRLRGFASKETVTLEITDMGVGIPPHTLEHLNHQLAQSPMKQQEKLPQDSIGLINIARRLKVSFGEEYGLHLVSALDKYTKVIMTLPLQPSPTQKPLQQTKERRLPDEKSSDR